MSEFKQGEMIEVRKSVDGDWILREYVCTHRGVIFCVHNVREHDISKWLEARALPSKPEPTPYNHETWPKQAVWMTATAEQEVMEQVVAIDTQGVQLQSGFVSFSTAAIERLISLDYCQTWQSCHYVPESE